MAFMKSKKNPTKRIHRELDSAIKDVMTKEAMDSYVEASKKVARSLKKEDWRII